jgi:hypothetical protein
MTVEDLKRVSAGPNGAATPAEFAQCLRAAMRAQRRSVDSVVRRSQSAGTPISRASIYNLLSGNGVPRRESVVAFLRGCGIPPQEQIRWLIAFGRAYPSAAEPYRPAARKVRP